jgi:hypothetical protein
LSFTFAIEMSLQFSRVARNRSLQINARALSAATKIQKKNKVFPSSAAAVADIPDGARIFIGGFGPCGLPENLLTAVKEAGPKDLHCVTNNPGRSEFAL